MKQHAKYVSEVILLKVTVPMNARTQTQTQPIDCITRPRSVKMYKDQLSLTNPRDALHHGERATNK